MSVIDDFLINVKPDQRAELNRIRKIVYAAVPDTEDTIGYGIPVIKINGKYLIGFSAFKNHLSIFPGSAPILELRNDLKEYKVAKGTIQFTPEKPLPESLLKRIIKICYREINQ